MKNLFIIIFSSLVCLSGFAQDVEKRYFENNPGLGGDAVIKSSSFKAEKDGIYKTFEVEVSEAGSYYLDAWIIAPFTKDGFVEYKVAVNDVLSGFSLTPQTRGWHSLALTDTKKSAATVKLIKGINKIYIIGKGPEIPNVEFIKLSSNLSRSGISDSKYRQFVESLESNTSNKVYSNELQQVSSVRGTNGEIYDYSLNLPFQFTQWYAFIFYPGENVNISVGSSSFPCAIEFFHRFTPESNSWSASSTSGPANLKATITEQGYYFIVIRSLYPNITGPATMSLSMDNYFSTFDCIVTYSPKIAVTPGYPTPANFFTCKTKENVDPWLFLANSSGRIRAYNKNGGKTSDGYSWDFNSRITTSLTDITHGMVFREYVYTPEYDVCDLYMGLASTANASYLLYSFPNLTVDNSFVSAPAGYYFCYHWSVGFDYVEEGKDIFDLYPSLSAGIEKWDQFYESYGYTNVGADSSNAAIALWTRTVGTTIYVNHASIRKNPNSQYPHGFEWESKCGSHERIMHTRDVFKSSPNPNTNYGSITRYYRPISGIVKNNFSSNSTRHISSFSTSDLNKVSTLKKQIPATVLSGFEEKYNIWENTWNSPELLIHSNLYKYAESAEYENLLNYCMKYGKAVWPLLFDKLAKKDLFVANLLKDLTYGGKLSFYDDILQYEKGKPFPFLSSILVDYCKGLLVKEEANIQNAIRNISATEEENFEVNISVNAQEILLNLYSIKDEKVFVSIYNTFGGLEFEARYNVLKGNQTLVINASNLKKGIYVVKITIDGKSISQTISI